MTEEQTYSNDTGKFLCELDQDICKLIERCVLLGKTESNNEDSDEEYIFISMIRILLENFDKTLSYEVSRITETSLRKMNDIYNDLCMKLKSQTESIIKENNESIFKCADPMAIAKYLTLVMEQFIKVGIRKCILVSKAESINEESYAYGEYIPVSILEGLLEPLVSKYSSGSSVKITTIITNREDELNALYMEKVAHKESSINIMNDLLREKVRLEEMHKDLAKQKAIDENEIFRFCEQIEKNKAITNQLKKEVDLMRKNEVDLNILEDMNISNAHHIDNKYSKDYPEELNECDRKKSSSIVCRFVNRNKRNEIISARKQVRGKKLTH